MWYQKLIDFLLGLLKKSDGKQDESRANFSAVQEGYKGLTHSYKERVHELEEDLKKANDKIAELYAMIDTMREEIATLKLKEAECVFKNKGLERSMQETERVVIALQTRLKALEDKSV